MSKHGDIKPLAKFHNDWIDHSPGNKNMHIKQLGQALTHLSGIIVLLKMPPKYRKLDYNKNKKAQKIMHTLTIFVDHGIIST